MSANEDFPGGINYAAWAKSAITFIREKGLEFEFQEWCGGWLCPIKSAALKPAPRSAPTAHSDDDRTVGRTNSEDA